MLKSKLDEVFERNPSAVDLREGLERVLSQIETKLKPKAIVLAGSMAKGKYVKGLSDIDLFVIADESKPRFMLEVASGVDVNVTVYTFEESFDAVRKGNQFILNAIESGIRLKGEEIIKKLLRSNI